MKPSKFRRILIFLIILLIGGYVGYFIGTNKISNDWQNYHLLISNKEPPQGMQNADFAQMWIVLSKLQESYYNKAVLDPHKLVNGAITGMVSSIGDPYTVYLPPTQNTNFKQSLAGQFSGIGAELGVKDKAIVVVAPLDGSPAQKAGVKSGDQVVSVDGQTTLGWSLDQTVNKIRGPKGTQVSLGVLHKSENKEANIKITRDTITVKSVTGWVKKTSDVENVKVPGDNKIAYIRLSQFGDNSNQDWLTVVNKLYLQMKNDTNVKGVVFDLRNNPGGYLTDAQYIASEFIADGIIVKEDNGTGDASSLSVSRKGLLTDVPLVVLINKGSASAAEIVSGALRDHGRAKLVGETSFGKGTVQQAEDLGGGAGLHVTIARWLTPNGTWVGDGKNGTGLKPDITVTLDSKDPTHDTQLEKAIQLLLQ